MGSLMCLEVNKSVFYCYTIANQNVCIYDSVVRDSVSKTHLSKIQGMQKIATTSNQFQIIIMNGGQKKTIIEGPITNRFFKFIQSGRPANTFCCYDFVQYVFDMYDQSILNRWQEDKWHPIERTREDNLQPGQVIGIYKKPCDQSKIHEKLQHVAIYLTTHVYISLYGIGGPLAVTSLDNMHLLYGTNAFCVINPIVRV